jgi:hypothetical protein
MKIHETVRIAAVMSVVFLALTASKAAYSQDGTEWLEYSPRNNPKAVGHNFTLKYPSSFAMQSVSSETDYLQIFDPIRTEGDPGEVHKFLSVNIQDLPDGFDLSSLKTDGYWNLRELDRFWADIAAELPGARDLFGAVSFEKLPMAKIPATMVDDGIITISAILLVLHGDKLVRLECGMSAYEAEPEFANEDYSKDPLCVSYFNSLTFTELP